MAWGVSEPDAGERNEQKNKKSVMRQSISIGKDELFSGRVGVLFVSYVCIRILFSAQAEGFAAGLLYKKSGISFRAGSGTRHRILQTDRTALATQDADNNGRDIKSLHYTRSG